MPMQQEKRGKERRDRSTPSPESPVAARNGSHRDASEELTGILSERIDNLGEAIQELDDAVAARRSLYRRFLKQIDEEMEEIYHQLGFLQPPWRAQFQPKIEFLRLSLHKSLTSRRKDIRSEEHKYWQDVVNLLKEKRKFLDEHKSLLNTKKRLVE